jgi:hypothetical protein
MKANASRVVAVPTMILHFGNFVFDRENNRYQLTLDSSTTRIIQQTRRIPARTKTRKVLMLLDTCVTRTVAMTLRIATNTAFQNDFLTFLISPILLIHLRSPPK